MLKSSPSSSINLHLLNGDGNRDRERLEMVARASRSVESWIVPKHSAVGDDAVINIPGFGLFATAKVASKSKPSEHWRNRYSADLNSIRLILPPISLTLVQRLVPELKWATYPRNITTPTPNLANQSRNLVADRKRVGTRNLNERDFHAASIDELRAIAVLSSKPSLPSRERKALERRGSKAIRLYVLRRAGGYCEGCSDPAPFRTAAGDPYLEVHHPLRKADGGPDHPAKVIALCPNCHRRTDFSADAKTFNASLKKKVAEVEAARKAKQL